MRRFLRTIGDGGGIQVINPQSLSPFVYLNSKLGMDAYADGAGIDPWFDQSGNVHNCGVAPGSMAAPIMRRTGLHISLNGSPLVEFNGLDFVAGSGLQNTEAGITPDTTPGATIILYGRFYYAVNTFQYGVGIADITNQRPQCIIEGSPHAGMGFRDTGHTVVTPTDLLPIGGSLYGSLVWDFQPPNVFNLYVNGVLQLTDTWSFNGGQNGYGLAGVGTADAAKMDLGGAVWFPRALTAGQRIGVTAFLRSQFG